MKSKFKKGDLVIFTIKHSYGYAVEINKSDIRLNYKHGSIAESNTVYKILDIFEYEKNIILFLEGLDFGFYEFEFRQATPIEIMQWRIRNEA